MGPMHENADHMPWLDPYEAITGAGGLVKLALQALVPEFRDEGVLASLPWVDRLKQIEVPKRHDPEHPSPTRDSVTGMTGATFDGFVQGAREYLIAIETCPPDPYEVNTSLRASADWPYVNGEERDWASCGNGRELAAMLVGYAAARSKSSPGVHARIPAEWLAAILAGLANAGYAVERTGSAGAWVKIRAWRRMDFNGALPTPLR